MMPRSARRLTAAAALLVSSACGGGGSSTEEGIALSLQVEWPATLQSAEDATTPLGSPLPNAAAEIEVVVSQGEREVCCVKFDPLDPQLGGSRQVVITDLPEGAAQVTLIASASRGVAPGHSSPQCNLARPLGFGDACDDTQCTQLSVSYSASASVTLAPGVPAKPDVRPTPELFVFMPIPDCAGSAQTNPPQITFTVASADSRCTCANALLRCPGETVDLFSPDEFRRLPVQLFDAAPRNGSCADAGGTRQVPLSGVVVACCADTDDCRRTNTCCTTATTGALVGITGLTFTATTLESLRGGCGRVEIATTPISASYGFAVPSPPPSPTPTPTRTPTITQTSTNTGPG